MTWLTNDELAQMRSDVANMLFDTAIIQALGKVSDGAGAFTETWGAVVGGTVLCRLDPVGANATEAQVVAWREALEVSYRLTVPHDAPITVNNRVVVDNKTYEVVSLAVDHSSNVSKRAIITEIR